MTGQTISHYRILDKLGQGGMGTVFKAEDTRLKRTVALKFLSTAALDEEEVRQRFIREAQAAAALDHPNICATYGIEDATGRAFIVMAYVVGEDLDKRLGRGPLTVGEALDIAVGVAKGLQEAHEKGVVHRDIKPGNIKITDKGPKVMDFGLAKLIDSPHLTKPGMTIGTAAYMSPEQTLGKPIDHRTDIWSMGVMMYQMLSGRLPFPGEYEQVIRYSVLSEEPEPLGPLCPEASPELQRIVLKAMAKDPDDRYQTAAELLADLRAERAKSRPPDTGASFDNTVTLQRQRRLTGVVIALAVLLLVAFGVIAWLALQ